MEAIRRTGARLGFASDDFGLVPAEWTRYEAANIEAGIRRRLRLD